MHPVKTDEPLPPPLPPPPLPLQPPRSSFSCDRHPLADNFTAFCPSCLSERLCIPDHSSSLTPAKSISKQHNGDHEVGFSQEEETTNLSDLENDILEMEAKIDTIVDNLKSVNDRIDLDAYSKNPSSSSSSSNFWSKKWKKWRSKHKKKEKKSVVEQNSVVSKKISRQYDETLSEIADYGLGRRSCDIGPRFSLDAGRLSVEEPKGAWDGYVIGRSFPKLPPMVGEPEPGGSTQTREYYLNSSRRRKGLERSNSSNSNSNTMVVDHNPNNNNNNAKVSPSVDYNQIHRRRLKFHSIGGEKELAGDDDDDGDGDVSSVKKTWWRNLKVKVWGNHTGSKNEDELRSRKLGRSNSSASWRNIGNNKCQGDEFVSEKNPDNGFLQFYLTPLRGSRNRNLKK